MFIQNIYLYLGMKIIFIYLLFGVLYAQLFRQEHILEDKIVPWTLHLEVILLWPLHMYNEYINR